MIVMEEDDGVEDGDLWSAVTRTITPLSGRPKPAVKEAPQKKTKKTKPLAKIVRPPSPPVAAKPPRPPADLSPGDLTAMDRRTADKFRRGQMAIEGVLDLHGHQQVRAHSELNAFISASAAGGKRCLLVVTGKGERQGVEKGWRGKGVLREAVPGWLNAPSNRAHVLSFCPAQPKDGGDGALYVLLKRNRDG